MKNNHDVTLLRLPQVRVRTGLSRSTIYQYISAGTFPKPVQLGPRAVAWIESEVAAWIHARIVKSRGEAA
jgi:prophage regulatory protein